jgi:hypothetical protein
MKHFAFLIIAAALALTYSNSAAAQAFKWTDENGRTVYSDTPPDPKLVKKVTRVNNSPAAGAGSGEVTTAEKVKKSDAAKKKSEEESKKEAKAERCKGLKADLAMYDTGGRIYTVNAKGEREFMTDEQIAAGKKRTEQQITEACTS